MNDPNRDRESSSEGLFSDEYVEVKRENPYLRKNRKKAELPPKKDAQLSEETADSADALRGGNGEETPARRKSDFFFEHVKLITAIFTAAVIALLLSVTQVIGFVQDFAEKQEQEEKKPLTLTYVEALTRKTEPITWSDLARFRRYDMSEATNSVTWFFEVSGTPYEVWISGVSTQKAPTYVHLYNMTTGEVLDLNEGDLSDFLTSETETEMGE